MFSLIKRLYNKRYTQREVELTKLPKIASNLRQRLPTLRNWMVPNRFSSTEFCSIDYSSSTLTVKFQAGSVEPMTP